MNNKTDQPVSNGKLKVSDGAHARGGKILLGLLPYWNPLIPPMGICCLKNYLQKHGYQVKTIDPNTEKPFKAAYQDYFDTLKEIIPENQRGNFFNVGHDVLRNQMMAYLHHTGAKKEYVELVRLIIHRHYFFDANEEQVDRLSASLKEYFSLLEEYLVRQIEAEQPSVFGLTVYTGTLPSSLFAYRLVKENYPDITTVMGGGIFAEHLLVNSSNLEFFLEKTPYIDKIIIGQGEELFLEYLEGKLPPSERVTIQRNVDSVKEGEDPPPFDMEIPDYSGLNTRKYPYLAISGSISCPHKCSFCNIRVYWGEFRQNATGKILDEMAWQYEKHGCQLFYVIDAMLNPYIDEFASKMLALERTFYYDGYLKVDELTCEPSRSFHWRRSGLYRARLGIESGSQHVLDLMEKNVTVEQIKTTLTNLGNAGIKTTCFWIVGHPGETGEDFQQTLDLVEEMKDYIYEAECAPFMYFYNAQNSGKDWTSKFKNLRMFPEEARDLLLIDTWILDCEPSREEMFRRFWRFVAHIERLGIPNPYSMYEVHKADLRWQELHSNSVPLLLEFQSRDKYIDECRAIKN